MTRTKEIQYLGQMLTATTEKDSSRMAAIIKRLAALAKGDANEQSD